MTSMRTKAAVWLAASLLLLSCTDSTNVELIQIETTGALFGRAFVDNDGDGELSGADDPLSDATVILTLAGGTTVVEEADTDTLGLFVMLDVPVGSYRLNVSPVSLGDSLAAVAETSDILVELGDTTEVNFGVSFPVLSIDEIRELEQGRRVFTAGIALNTRVGFGDGQVHLQAGDSYLRALNVERANLFFGDSVRFLGRTSVDNGLPVLDEVTPFVLISQAAIPIAKEVTSAKAATADDAQIDAALVSVRTGEISDTSTVNGNFHFMVDDGSGPVEIVLRSYLQLDPVAVRPDTIVRVQRVIGLLTPVADGAGGVRWRVLPRAAQDFLLELKQADLRVEATANPDEAHAGDTVAIEVVVTNGGPAVASGVEVTDTVPNGLTFLSADATRGSYDVDTGLWPVDSLFVGAADTLTLTFQVDSIVGTVRNITFVDAPANEVDPDFSNNGWQAVVVVTPPPAEVRNPPRR